MTRPSRVTPPRTWPGGVQTVGPILRIPGRTLFANRADLAEAEQHARAVLDAVAALRDEYPEASPDGPWCRVGRWAAAHYVLVGELEFNGHTVMWTACGKSIHDIHPTAADKHQRRCEQCPQARDRGIAYFTPDEQAAPSGVDLDDLPET